MVLENQAQGTTHEHQVKPSKIIKSSKHKVTFKKHDLKNAFSICLKSTIRQRPGQVQILMKRNTG